MIVIVRRKKGNMTAACSSEELQHTQSPAGILQPKQKSDLLCIIAIFPCQDTYSSYWIALLKDTIKCSDKTLANSIEKSSTR